jgi:HAD superfamily hydrolase (TIGR01509 family)
MTKMITTFLFDFYRVLLLPKDLGDFELNEPLFNYLDSIKDKKELYIFTSSKAPNIPVIKKRLEPIFRRVFSARETGYGKREPEAYAMVAREIGKRPEEILFIDDSAENLEAAKKANLNVLQYQNFEKLHHALQTL